MSFNSLVGATGLAYPGRILQVVSTTKTDTFSTTSTTFTDITGLTATITPTSTASKILVFVNSNYSNSGGGEIGLFRLLRGATVIAAGDAAGSRSPAFATTRIPDVAATIAVAVNHLDSPATQSSTVYKVQMQVQGSTGYVNRTAGDVDAASQGRSVSSITLMEVSA